MGVHFLRNSVSFITAQKGYGPTDCRNQITHGCHWKRIRFLKPAALSFFSFLSSFFSFDSFGQAEGSKKMGNLLHQPAKETGCLSGQLYIWVIDFP